MLDTARRIKAAPGSSPRREPIGEDATTLAIAPLGRRLAYSRTVSDVDIWRLNLRNRTEMAGPPAKFIASTHIDGNPTYSSDGKRIVFNSHRSGAQEVWAANAEGANPLQLTTASGPMVADPRWSPDGQNVVIHSMRGGVRGIDLVGASGGAIRRLVEGGGTWPTWLRDGKWIYYGRDGQLWRISAERTPRIGRGEATHDAIGPLPLVNDALFADRRLREELLHYLGQANFDARVVGRA